MNDAWPLIMGAGLAVVGGILGYEYNARRDSSRELKSIKVSISDELSDIETTIHTMYEVWEKSKTLYPSYFATLQQGTSSFDCLRERLWLIKDAALRKKVVSFYKKLKDVIKENESKIGSLSDTPETKAEQASIATTFKSLEGEAKDLRFSLEKKSFWPF